MVFFEAIKLITKQQSQRQFLIAALAYEQAAVKNGNTSHTVNFPDELPIKEKEKESVIKDGGYLVSWIYYFNHISF